VNQAKRLAYTFLADGESEEERITYVELDRRAREIAVLLKEKTGPGERALLLYPPGIEFIAAFLGCLYAGVIAVPAYPPDPARLDRTLPRLLAIAKDSGSEIVLTTEMIRAVVESLFESVSDLKRLAWIATDRHSNGAEADWAPPRITSDTIAFLQYTSGSTGSPKGVMISHGNLMHNSRLIRNAAGHRPESVGVIWLPPYHDMGLIGGILQPLYTGFPVVLFSPLDFLSTPLRWLQAVTRYRATTSGGPNFAYDLCVRKISPEQREKLDLRSWDVAFCGAEPIRAETLRRFAEYFEPCGFSVNTFYSCYGLAENTLIVTGGKKAAPPIIKKRLAHGKTRELVGCGSPLENQKLVVVDPESLCACPENQEGELWVQGPSTARGYWNRRAETEETFHAFLKTGEGPFLRTGDLGFLREGELFVTERLKDLIIIRGENYYSHDIERTVETCYPGLRRGCGAAFSFDGNGEEQVVVVQEVERRFHERREGRKNVAPLKERRSASDRRREGADPWHDPEERKEFDPSAAFEAICKAVSEEHGLEIHAILFLKAGTIPKTTSGKIQRFLCKAGFLDRTLDVIAEWKRDSSSPDRDGQNRPSLTRERLLAAPPQVRLSLLEAYLAEQAAKVLRLRPSEVNMQKSFHHLGLGSLTAVELKSRIENDLSLAVPLIKLVNIPSLSDLARLMLDQLTSGVSPDKAFSLRAGNELSEFTRLESNSLPEMIASGKEPPVDAAGLMYIADPFLHEKGLSLKGVRDLTRDQPFLTSVMETSMGRTAIIVLPRVLSQIYSHQKDFIDLTLKGLELASRIGARVVSLMGSIPAATDYGRLVVQAADGHRNLPRISTGHATTTASVVLAVGRILREGGRHLSKEKVAFLGLGSIGLATLRLMLQSMPHPAEIMLCDLYSKRFELEEIKKEMINEYGYQGPVRLLESRPEIPADLYEQTLIVSATNVADVLDISKCKPGTLIVDDSFPYCFDAPSAMERFRRDGDMLVTGGGLVRSPDPIREIRHRPNPQDQRAVLAEMSAFSVIRPDPYTIVSCLFSGLLSATFADLQPTVGKADANVCLQHLETLKQLGFEAAPLNCAGHLLDHDTVRAFKDRFS
jgi:acyl-CoA synthetase (AMP-forming)/AMP-acid ligase II/predicted amino acid dehydrogenase/acyl carrier protein